MDPNRLRKIEEIYHAARERTPESRAALLGQADADLRREVEALLIQDSVAGPLDRAAVEVLEDYVARPLAAGAQLGPYRIEALLGEGGMGRVYRAVDTRLGRSVAVKIAHERFSARFEREAQAISSLNHPHICTLHDVGPDYLVMELLEGETLAARLKKGPLSVEQAVRYGAEIVDALAAAHDRGMVHRDLKPANIMLTKAGIKVLDFGLAKMAAASAEAATVTVTEPGMIVGTLRYLSPEQVQGKDADARSDIFAFGLVLYEMLTGRRAFEGESAASVMAGILEKDVPRLGDAAAPGLEWILRRALAKDPAERWQSARDLKETLERFGGAASPEPRTRRRFNMAWLAAALFSATAATALVVALRERPPVQRVVRFQIPDASTAAVSPDGTRIVFSSGNRLAVQSLDALSAEELAGTEGGYAPFWAPDGRSLGFFANGALKKIGLSGGGPEKLADVLGGLGGAWSRDGAILFSAALYSPLMRIAAVGGSSAPVTKLDPARRESRHDWPSLLPDGKHFLFTVFAEAPANSGVFMGSLDSPLRTRLLPEMGKAQYAEPGFILFMRGGALMAQPFDAVRLRFTGDAFPLAQQISSFSASAGVLAYQPQASNGQQRLRWFDRKGNPVGDLGPAGDFAQWTLSPDGRSIALGPHATYGDIWVYDLVRGTNSRLTVGGGDHNAPSWSPDGREIAFSFDSGARRVVHRMAANLGAKEELAAQLDRSVVLWQWTADGRYLIMTAFGSGKPYEVWAAPLSGGKPFPVVTGPFNNHQGRVSPDGKWIAYVGEETGGMEIYLQDFPPTGRKWQISTAGGQLAKWRADGRELFYREGTKMMSVEMRVHGGELEAGIPKTLFEAPNSLQFYDVSRDGQKFLMAAGSAQQGPLPPLMVVVNWVAEIKR